MRKVLLVFAILLPVALVIGVLFWYFVIYQKPTPNPSGTTNPTPSAGFGNLSPYAKLCASFQNTNSKISCEKAVELALGEAPGNVQNVSIGTVSRIIPNLNPPKRENAEAWLIDIKLQNSYFDTNFKKEVKELRIGIGMQQHWGFYKQSLQ